MKKYLLALFCFNGFYYLSVSQTIHNERIVRKEIDSLKNKLPGLHDSSRVDCMLTLTYKYENLDLDWKQTLDSCGPFARQASNEANQLGYKKGLGYSYLAMADLENLKNSIYLKEHNQYSDDLFDTQEQYIRSAIPIGEQIKNNTMLGDAYVSLSGTADKKNKPAQFKSYLNKAIACYLQAGNRIKIGNLYRYLGRRYNGKNENAKARKYIEKAAEYFNKTTDKATLAITYSELSYIAFRGYDYQTAVDVSKKAITLFHETGDEENEISAINELCKMYEVLGDFENGVEYCKKSILLAEKLARNKVAGSENNRTWGQAFFWMCRLYKISGDYVTAMDIICRGRYYYPTDSISTENWKSEMGDVHRLMGNYDSALYYLEPFAKTKQETNNFGKVGLGYLYINLKEYDKALRLITPVIQYLKKKNRIMPPMINSLMIAANAFLGKKKYWAALQYAREGLADLRIMNGKVLMISDYKLLSDIFRKLDKNDSAYFYLNQYTVLKDSLLNRQFYWKLSNYKKETEEAGRETEISLLSKDNKIKNQKLKQQTLVKNFLFAGSLSLLLIGLFVYRNLSLKRKNEKLVYHQVQSQLQQKATDLEMQALRAQMNPHFIFNCLSSINRFILKNETEIASDYLTKFSRLIRMVLIHSQSSEVLLKDEIEVLRLYLEMEQLRFKNSFDYNISFTNFIDPEIVFIPPLLLQPFCENAIWHGLMHKEEYGCLEIKLSMQDDNLNCIITDNGIGRKRSAELKSRSGEMYKSVGLKITVERLALMNKEIGLHTSYRVEDVLDVEGNVAGTKVILNIRCKDNIKASVKESTI